MIVILVSLIFLDLIFAYNMCKEIKKLKKENKELKNKISCKCTATVEETIIKQSDKLRELIADGKPYFFNHATGEVKAMRCGCGQCPECLEYINNEMQKGSGN